MAILADTIKKLLTKSGFDIESEAYRKLIGLKELVVDIPDEVDGSLSGLMSLNEAKNNIDIKKHYKAEVLDPINNKISVWLKEVGADHDLINEISNDPNTYKKVELSLKKIAELKSKAAESGNKGDKAELERKVNELSAQLSKIATDAAKDKEDAIAAITNKYEMEFTDLEINRILGGKQLPGLFDRDIEIKMAREFLNKKLAEKNAQIKKVDGKLKLFSKDDETIRIFEAGNELDISTLTDMALADNKFLKVSGDGGGENFQNRQRDDKSQTKLSSAAAEALSDLDTALQGFKQ